MYKSCSVNGSLEGCDFLSARIITLLTTKHRCKHLSNGGEDKCYWLLLFLCVCTRFSSLNSHSIRYPLFYFVNHLTHITFHHWMAIQIVAIVFWRQYFVIRSVFHCCKYIFMWQKLGKNMKVIWKEFLFLFLWQNEVEDVFTLITWKMDKVKGEHRSKSHHLKWFPNIIIGAKIKPTKFTKSLHNWRMRRFSES